jgi:hypothetical protein
VCSERRRGGRQWTKGGRGQDGEDPLKARLEEKRRFAHASPPKNAGWAWRTLARANKVLREKLAAATSPRRKKAGWVGASGGHREGRGRGGKRVGVAGKGKEKSAEGFGRERRMQPVERSNRVRGHASVHVRWTSRRMRRAPQTG